MLLNIVGNGQNVAWIASSCVAEFVDLEDVRKMVLWIFGGQSKEQILQVRQRVWLKVAEEYNVILIFEGVREAHSIHADLHGLLAIIFIARYHIVIPIIVRLTYTRKISNMQ